MLGLVLFLTLPLQVQVPLLTFCSLFTSRRRDGSKTQNVLILCSNSRSPPAIITSTSQSIVASRTRPCPDKDSMQPHALAPATSSPGRVWLGLRYAGMASAAARVASFIFIAPTAHTPTAFFFTVFTVKLYSRWSTCNKCDSVSPRLCLSRPRLCHRLASAPRAVPSKPAEDRS